MCLYSECDTDAASGFVMLQHGCCIRNNLHRGNSEWLAWAEWLTAANGSGDGAVSWRGKHKL